MEDINKMFWFYMNAIGNILKFIIVIGITGFLLLIPLVLKGGWILYLIGLVYVVIILAFCISFYSSKENKDE